MPDKNSEKDSKKILVIKLSALGDFVQATGPFAAIRKHHERDHITLLTTSAYASFAKASPYFDEVWIDERPKAWQFFKVAKLKKRLVSGGFDMVYDLQTSGRSSRYFKLMPKGTKWSGIAKGCSHPHSNYDRDFMHTIERQAEQLSMAGIKETPLPDVSWASSDISRFDLPEKYILMVAGGAPHRPEKRWHSDRYAELANNLVNKGYIPVLLGAAGEKKEIENITAKCSKAVSLAGKTSFEDIASLAIKAKAAVGNDTGPMHMIAAAGCKSVVLYSYASNPALCAQRGKDVTIIRKESFDELSVTEVEKALIS